MAKFMAVKQALDALPRPTLIMCNRLGGLVWATYTGNYLDILYAAKIPPISTKPPLTSYSQVPNKANHPSKLMRVGDSRSNFTVAL